ncbi:hypothetical protein BDW59DRAFT_151824 [Aspergillus cavernicola]|uniref:Berberine/berberine-like domain-containing protein n=1 Tax=Aspergillus cavernicola TaxID=176166 RepID=A0ABR4HTG1_9EURO
MVFPVCALHMQSMSAMAAMNLVKADFKNPEILSAANPSKFGLYHGSYYKKENYNKVSKINSWM